MASIIRESIDRTTTFDEACTALESNPQSPESWLGFIESLRACGRTEQAVAALALGGRHGLAGPAVEGFRALANIDRFTEASSAALPAG